MKPLDSLRSGSETEYTEFHGAEHSALARELPRCHPADFVNEAWFGLLATRSSCGCGAPSDGFAEPLNRTAACSASQFTSVPRQAFFALQAYWNPSASSRVAQRVAQLIVDSNPILEAFGNAKTFRNDNSSRFGKWVAMQFTPSGQVCGGKLTTYLLEGVRVLGLRTESLLLPRGQRAGDARRPHDEADPLHLFPDPCLFGLGNFLHS